MPAKAHAFGTIALSLIALLLTHASATAQVPSVLDLQKSYHLGVYSGTVDTPGGALRLLAQFGDMDLLANGTLSGALDTYETDVFGTTFTPNGPISATYTVRGDGQIVLDLDPSNPGVDLFSLWISPDGSALHSARHKSTADAIGIMAIEKSTGLGNASLNGSYRFVGQRLEFVGSTWNTFGEWGVATFNGAGAGTVLGTELSAAPAGSTTLPLSNAFAYSVASDGSILIDGNAGAMSANGELFFFVVAEPTGEVGMTIAVRIGSSHNLQNMASRFSLSSERYTLGSGPSLPRTTTELGAIDLVATSATAGTWSTTGVTVDGTPQSITLNPSSRGGAVALGSNGALTLNYVGGALDGGLSSNDAYFVGREVGTSTSLVFGMRQCLVSTPYGTGTPGTGGIAPALGMKTFPVVGNSGWRFAIAKGLGGGIGVLPIGFAPWPGVPALGGLIWVDATALGLTAIVLLNGTPGLAGAGGAEVPIAIPNTPSLNGVSLFAQALVLDPAAPAGFSMSNGFEATISR